MHETPHDALCRLTATKAVLRLKRREITPLDLIDAAARRIAQVEPAINALPTLCIARARAHAERLMRGEGCEAEGEPGWLAGLPVAIKNHADVAGVRTTYGSPIFRDHVPTRSHPVVERIERKGGIVICTVEPLSDPAAIRRCARKRIHGALCWL
jgi:amidase